MVVEQITSREAAKGAKGFTTKETKGHEEAHVGVWDSTRRF